jgi:hypothetical protein
VPATGTSPRATLCAVIRSAKHPAVVALIAALSSACQNDYPLEPTPCDDWCYATERVACGNNDPASCVAACEADGNVPGPPQCRELWEAALSCYEKLPDEAVCPWQLGHGEAFSDACGPEMSAYMSCIYGIEPR